MREASTTTLPNSEPSPLDTALAAFPPRLTRSQLHKLAIQSGYPLSKSSLDKLCAPSSPTPPPVACKWGRRDLYDRDRVLSWLASLSGPTVAIVLGLATLFATSTPSSATTLVIEDDFCGGFFQGYDTGWKLHRQTHIHPLKPPCPLQEPRQVYEPSTSWERGYVVGLFEGLRS